MQPAASVRLARSARFAAACALSLAVVSTLATVRTHPQPGTPSGPSLEQLFVAVWVFIVFPHGILAALLGVRLLFLARAGDTRPPGWITSLRRALWFGVALNIAASIVLVLLAVFMQTPVTFWTWLACVALCAVDWAGLVRLAGAVGQARSTSEANSGTVSKP